MIVRIVVKSLIYVNKPSLQIDWASHAAAKYACENWHYSKCLPVGKLVKVGAWENGKYIGVVLFGRGANRNMGAKFGLGQDKCVELVRIALTKHEAPVSRICALAIRYLKSQSPDIELIVSYADPEQNHHGGIYQAMNWTYTGLSASAKKVWYKGKWTHKKTVDDAGIDQTNLPIRIATGKHTYVYPMTTTMKEKVVRLSKPFPKRHKQAESGPPELRQCNTDHDAPITQGAV